MSAETLGAHADKISRYADALRRVQTEATRTNRQAAISPDTLAMVCDELVGALRTLAETVAQYEGRKQLVPVEQL